MWMDGVAGRGGRYVLVTSNCSTRSHKKHVLFLAVWVRLGGGLTSLEGLFWSLLTTRGGRSKGSSSADHFGIIFIQKTAYACVCLYECMSMSV